jgi:isochorismate synthase
MKKKNPEEMELRLSDSNKINDIQTAISHLLSEGFEFAVYSHPNDKEVHVLIASDYSSPYGYLLSDFNSTFEHLIPADYHLTSENIKNALSLKNTHPKPSADYNESRNDEKQSFINYVSGIIDACKNNHFEKCVAARAIECKLTDKKPLAEIFTDLLNAYPNAFVNLFASAKGIWAGATPEILVKQQSTGKYTTMSLAGTKKIAENRQWTDKEREEQAIVTRYICQNLSTISDNVECSETITHQAGHLEHIKTSIYFDSSSDIRRIASLLHPTPAVCGFPTDLAKEYIAKHEKSRHLYAGYTGPYLENDKSLYVNLRCMQIGTNNATLYVGAGITKDSNAESEWEETAAKAQTLLKIIQL